MIWNEPGTTPMGKIHGGKAFTIREAREVLTMANDSEARPYPHFVLVAREVLEGKRELDDPTCREMLCSDCPFYHPEEDENLECGCYLLLRELLRRGGLDLRRALEVLGHLHE